MSASRSTAAAVCQALSSDVIAEPDIFGRRHLERLGHRVGRADAARKFVAAAGFDSRIGQHFEVRRAALGMNVEHALRELGHLGDPAGDADAGHRMGADVFQHAANEIAHVDQRDLGQAVQPLDRASEVEPVAPATWSRPAARATSTPRKIEWIQAEQE